ncbi:zinc finger, CCHC-type containing protein [Tanacetum coccineum]
MECYRNLRIVFSTKDKLPFFEQPIPTLPVPPDGQANPLDVVTTHQAWVKAQKEIAGLMIMTMDPDIQKNLEHLGAYDMLKELKTLYVQQADQELLQTSYIDNLERLGHAMTQNLSVNLILVSLRKEYDVAPALHAIRAGRIRKNQKKKSHKAAKRNQGKGKAKMGYAPVQAPPFAPKPKNPPTPKKRSYLKELALQGLKGSRKLKPGAISLYMGDGHRATVEAIREFYLCLLSGLVLILRNCHYAPSITQGIISLSLLYKDDDIYEIVLSSFVTNDSSIYVVINKRAKLNLDSALLWHCRLEYINKKHIEKLQHDGLLNSTDIKSFEKCVACMSGKMARKPDSHQVERAKDLLGLIHTDVCGPFKIMSRQGASYFVTFTDDFSHYGYVYLLKHKHEVFETFKVFQKEVENQLGNSIKSLRSDRGERRNRTLLDMVRSMMSQTTLPKSFWDYALSLLACILNMVPTKKVDKTPYEVWHGQAPKLSYLKVWGCEALVKRDTRTKPSKLEPRAFKCIFNDVIDHETSGSLEDPEIIQEEDTHPSLDTSLDHEEDDQEIDKSQSDINPICRSTRTRRPTNRLHLYVDAEEHELGDLGEPANYKAALLNPKSDKWLNAMNVEMQSMKDNEV